jgi:hypothetical protein
MCMFISTKSVVSLTLTIPALHAYACDCITHHLFHPYGTDCLQNASDMNMMHQVAADDSLQSMIAYRCFCLLAVAIQAMC